MNVVIEPAVLEDSQYFSKLNAFFDDFLDRRHYWDNCEIAGESSWFQELGDTHQADYKKYVVDSMYQPSPHKLKLTIGLDPEHHTDNRDYLSPEEAKYCLQAPLKLLVEDNDRNQGDAAFILAMLEIFKENNDDLSQAIKKHWIEFEHLGGIGNACKKFQDAEEKPKGPLRLVIIVDGDQRYPEDKPRVQSTIKESIPKKHHHILFRRTIENYLPLEMLKEIFKNDGNAIEKLNILMDGEQLSAQHYYYFPMKKGLEKDLKSAKDDAQYQEFWPPLDKAPCQLLKTGFGDKISQYFGSNHYQHYHSLDSATKQRYESEIKPEIDTLFAKIRALL